LSLLTGWFVWIVRRRAGELESTRYQSWIALSLAAIRKPVALFFWTCGGAFALLPIAAGIVSRPTRIFWARALTAILYAGWIIALPVPVLVGVAPSWAWVVVANALLGINQGLTWSMTVVMKIDLVGPLRRGFALGLNEAAGYGGVAIAAAVSGWVASVLAPRDFLLFRDAGHPFTLQNSTYVLYSCR